MAQELSSVETLHTNFVSSVSHEMKTPVAQISNYATLLQNPNLSEDERIELAEGTAKVARRLSDLVTNVLRLSRLENNPTGVITQWHVTCVHYYFGFATDRPIR